MKRKNQIQYLFSHHRSRGNIDGGKGIVLYTNNNQYSYMNQREEWDFDDLRLMCFSKSLRIIRFKSSYTFSPHYDMYGVWRMAYMAIRYLLFTN